MRATQLTSRIRFLIVAITACVLIFVGTPPHCAAAAQVTLAWDANTETDLAGYKLHYGTGPGAYSNHMDVLKTTSCTVTGLTAGQTYYFAASAYDTDGNESAYSNMVSTTIVSSLNLAPAAPAAPAGPASLTIGAAAGFSTSAVDPNGDSLQFRYDWGAGVLSNWGAAAQATSWSAAGQYSVKAQARDGLGLESGWSEAKVVTVTQNTSSTDTSISAGISIWSDSVTPSILSDSDANAVELGMKFRSSVAGYITGIKFYKSAGNTGTHVGNLWTAAGAKLAGVTFSAETASGWQYQSLTTPVAISANTTYVVSYYTPVGRYSANTGYFASGVDSYPLRALSTGESGGNGVYSYGASAFPNQTYNSSNYWVDVVFKESLGSGTTNAAPTTPATPSGASAALVNTAVTFTTSATDPNGDSLQFRYDWGGGLLSSWGSVSQSRSWTAAGQYAVKAQARDSLGKESAWSGAKTVTITQGSTPGVVDSDGDGVPDSRDAFPNNPKEWADANGNGIGDNADAAAGPAAPQLVSPASHATVSVTTLLTTGAYRTPSTGATHAQTRWQVFREEDDACVLDIRSATALTSIPIPRLVLEEDTPYFWRAQFIDSKGAASAWSDYGYFSTQLTGSDRNANGIPDAQEVASYIDLDRDGVTDNQQATIRSFKTARSGVQAGVSIKGCPTALAIEGVESESVLSSDIAWRIAFGRINFKIAVANSGDRATVKLYFSKAARSGSKYYGYDSIAGKWSDFSAYAAFAADLKSVSLTLVDGGMGDADGVANGVIVNAGGIYTP